MDKFLQFMVTGRMLCGLYSLVALGLVIIYKSSRVLNLAHGGFLMLLSFMACSAAEQIGLPMWLSIVIVLVISIGLGFVVERVILRPLTGQPILATIRYPGFGLCPGWRADLSLGRLDSQLS